MAKKRRQSRILKPKKELSFVFRDIRFFTYNLGAIDPMTHEFVWFAVGKWTHDGQTPHTVFSSIDSAVADRFGLKEQLETPQFRAELRSEIAQAIIVGRKYAAAKKN